MSDANEESERSVRHRGDQPPAMPRWVKAGLIVAGVLLLVFVVLKLTGMGGQHGPGMHRSARQVWELIAALEAEHLGSAP